MKVKPEGWSEGVSLEEVRESPRSQPTPSVEKEPYVKFLETEGWSCKKSGNPNRIDSYIKLGLNTCEARLLEHPDLIIEELTAQVREKRKALIASQIRVGMTVTPPAPSYARRGKIVKIDDAYENVTLELLIPGLCTGPSVEVKIADLPCL